MSDPIPVIDIFAGPGGLGEGFARLRVKGQRRFRSALSIEKDPAAHETLTLRAFYRQFEPDQIPADYFRYIRREICKEKLFRDHGRAAKAAAAEAWRAELGSPQYPVSAVRDRVSAALGRSKDWVLLGGPPCQAYSLVGRSRNRGIEGYKLEHDHRATLYVEYLQLIADFGPTVFVMENVKGLLSAKLDGESLFERILDDLSNPSAAIRREKRTTTGGAGRGYDLYPLVTADGLFAGSDSRSPSDFIIRAEQFGVPQARHRVIIVGVRRGTGVPGPRPLTPVPLRASVGQVIGDLPHLRSGLSDRDSSDGAWAKVVSRLAGRTWQAHLVRTAGARIAERVAEIAGKASGLAALPRHVIDQTPRIAYERDWYEAAKMPFVVNHHSRTHMASDLTRYLFAAAFAEVEERSPGLNEFPTLLLPNHANARGGGKPTPFADRFRVQRRNHPSTTVTSHISRDGHYYIHYDPEQCRSLTVREAARLQTFPDTYFFEGNRTSQYVQVGNAVPPLLAHRIADRISELLH